MNQPEHVSSEDSFDEQKSECSDVDHPAVAPASQIEANQQVGSLETLINPNFKSEFGPVNQRRFLCCRRPAYQQTLLELLLQKYTHSVILNAFDAISDVTSGGTLPQSLLSESSTLVSQPKSLQPLEPPKKKSSMSAWLEQMRAQQNAQEQKAKRREDAELQRKQREETELLRKQRQQQLGEDEDEMKSMTPQQRAELQRRRDIALRRKRKRTTREQRSEINQLLRQVRVRRKEALELWQSRRLDVAKRLFASPHMAVFEEIVIDVYDWNKLAPSERIRLSTGVLTLADCWNLLPKCLQTPEWRVSQSQLPSTSAQSSKSSRLKNREVFRFRHPCEQMICPQLNSQIETCLNELGLLQRKCREDSADKRKQNNQRLIDGFKEVFKRLREDRSLNCSVCVFPLY